MKPNQAIDLLVANLKKAWDVRQPSGILCHKFKFIYFPIAKVAGSSIRMMIAEMEGLPVTGKPYQLPFELVRMRELKDYPDYQQVVVVRDPWARLYSCYKGKMCWQRMGDGKLVRRTELTPGFARYNRLLGPKMFDLDMTFGEFVRSVGRIPDAFADRHFRSQYKAFSHPDGTPFAGRIVRLENFQEDMQSFLTGVGAGGFELKHLNRSSDREYLEQYDDDLANMAARRYRRDIELLKYTSPQVQPNRFGASASATANSVIVTFANLTDYAHIFPV